MTPLEHAYLLKGWSLDKNPPQEVTKALEAVITALDKSSTHLPIGFPTDTERHPPQDKPAIEPAIEGVTDAREPASVAESASETNREKHPEPKQPRKAKTIPVEEADAVRRLVKEERSDDEIGQELGYPVIAVKNFRKEHEIARPRGNPNYRRSSDMPTASPPPASTIEIRKAASQPPAPVPAPKPKPIPQIDVDRLITVHKGYAGKREDGTLTDSDWPDIKARLVKSPDRKAIASDYDVDLEDLNFFIQSCQRREQRSGEAPASPFQQTSGATRRQP